MFNVEKDGKRTKRGWKRIIKISKQIKL